MKKKKIPEIVPTQEEFHNLCKQYNIEKTEISRFSGFAKSYAAQYYRPFLYYCTICLIAEKKGISLERILNIK